MLSRRRLLVALFLLPLGLAVPADFADAGQSRRRSTSTRGRRPPSGRTPPRAYGGSSAHGDDVYYPNCSAARAAGAAPIRAGEPGYRPALDRDRDGVACE